jgi:L-iditol 2-dehydrogenase
VGFDANSARQKRRYGRAVKVAPLVGIRQFRIEEAAIAPPGPGEVQIQVRAVGICGSDLHAYAEGAVGDLACSYPMVLGHEPTGVVAAVGSGVTGWAVGDPAVAEPAHYCYHCPLCLRGRHNLCLHLRFLSTPGHPGFFRDRVNLPPENLLPLPKPLSLAQGTLVEPLAVVLHSLNLVSPKLGESAVVIGAGPIGLLTIAALKHVGVHRVTAIEPVPHRRELARLMGADTAVFGPAPDLARDIVKGSGGLGVDLVFDCATKGSPNLALQLAASGGRVVYTGIPSELEVPIDVHLWRRKELSVHQVRRSNHDSIAALSMITGAPQFFAPLLTHERPLDEIGRAFAIVEGYEDGVGKMIVRLGEGGA